MIPRLRIEPILIPAMMDRLMDSFVRQIKFVIFSIILFYEFDSGSVQIAVSQCSLIIKKPMISASLQVIADWQRLPLFACDRRRWGPTLGASRGPLTSKAVAETLLNMAIAACLIPLIMAWLWRRFQYGTDRLRKP